MCKYVCGCEEPFGASAIRSGLMWAPSTLTGRPPGPGGPESHRSASTSCARRTSDEKQNFLKRTQNKPSIWDYCCNRYITTATTSVTTSITTSITTSVTTSITTSVTTSVTTSITTIPG
ncbi:unnamed protein product [Gadus morhua 'NCC']